MLAGIRAKSPISTPQAALVSAVCALPGASGVTLAMQEATVEL